MLPKRPKEHVTDARSIDLIRGRVHELGWVLRELTSDYGIDAEIRDDPEQMTGALLRFQIKGNSTLRAVEGGKVSVKISSLRYWLVSPIPIFMARIQPSIGKIEVLRIEDYLQERKQLDHVRSTSNKTLSIDFSYAYPFDEMIDYLADTAIEHQSAILDISQYTLYNPSSQFIEYHRLFRQHGGDINKMIRWYRLEAGDENLIYDYGYAVHLKKQIDADPAFLEQIRTIVYEDEEQSSHHLGG